MFEDCPCRGGHTCSVGGMVLGGTANADGGGCVVKSADGPASTSPPPLPARALAAFGWLVIVPERKSASGGGLPREGGRFVSASSKCCRSTVADCARRKGLLFRRLDSSSDASFESHAVGECQAPSLSNLGGKCDTRVCYPAAVAKHVFNGRRQWKGRGTRVGRVYPPMIAVRSEPGLSAQEGSEHRQQTGPPCSQQRLAPGEGGGQWTGRSTGGGGRGGWQRRRLAEAGARGGGAP